jgi:hypothetical protein
MTRRKTFEESFQSASDRVSMIAATVWQYEEKRYRLSGPERDAVLIRDLFCENSEIALHSKKRFHELQNPSIEELRSAIVEYVIGRSAKGDVLVLYFSGHGAVLHDNTFALVLRDSKGRQDGGVLPLGVLRLDDIAATLASADIFPVFILDACYSGKAQATQLRVIQGMQDSAKRSASAYALFCACYETSEAKDNHDGGEFTKALATVVKRGMPGKYRKKKFLTLEDLLRPVQEEMQKSCFPLPRHYVGSGPPNFPFVRNRAHRAKRLALAGDYIQILETLAGSTNEDIAVDLFANISKGAYANNSKLKLSPWSLIEDGTQLKTRRLSQRGRQFVSGELKVPDRIEEVNDQVWERADDAKDVSFQEISSGRGKAKNAESNPIAWS